MNTLNHVVKNEAKSLTELTNRESGILLFQYKDSVGAQMIIGNWTECPDGTLPMLILGRSIIAFPCKWSCVNTHRTESVWDVVPENTELVFDKNGDAEDLEIDDPKGTVYDIVTADGRSVTVIVPDGWN